MYNLIKKIKKNCSLVLFELMQGYYEWLQHQESVSVFQHKNVSLLLIRVDFISENISATVLVLQFDYVFTTFKTVFSKSIYLQQRLYQDNIVLVDNAYSIEQNAFVVISISYYVNSTYV